MLWIDACRIQCIVEACKLDETTQVRVYLLSMKYWPCLNVIKCNKGERIWMLFVNK